MQRARTCSSVDCILAKGLDMAQSGRTEGSIEVSACSHANCAPVAASSAVRHLTQCRKRQGQSRDVMRGLETKLWRAYITFGFVTECSAGRTLRTFWRRMNCSAVLHTQA